MSPWCKILEFPYVLFLEPKKIYFQVIKVWKERSPRRREKTFLCSDDSCDEKIVHTVCSSRMLFGQMKFNGPSRFIYEIPNDFIIGKRYHQKTSFDSDTNGMTLTKIFIPIMRKYFNVEVSFFFYLFKKSSCETCYLRRGDCSKFIGTGRK